MRRLIAFTVTTAFVAFGAVAQEAEDPFHDAVEIRHGLMLSMASDLGKLGAMAKGEVAYDTATATKAAANLAAIASVVGMDQFPAGSEVGKSADSFAMAELWADQPGFLAKVADLNTAAAAMQVAAATDAEAIKVAMAGVGGACGSCHKAFRQPE